MGRGASRRKVCVRETATRVVDATVSFETRRWSHGLRAASLGHLRYFPMGTQCASQAHKSTVMSVRAHFWLRVAGLAIILAAQFAPRIWAPSGAASAGGTKVASAEAR